MAGVTAAGDKDKEKSLYLRQIQYLEEQLDRCQRKREELEKQNKDLASRYTVLEKDKRGITEYLKRSLAAKEEEMDELRCQQQAIKQEGQVLKLEYSKQMLVLQGRVEELRSVSMLHVAKSEEKEEQLMKLMQRLSDMEDLESLEKQLVSQRKEHEAAIESLKREAELERKKVTERILDTEENCVEIKTSNILEGERAQHRERLEQIQFLQKDSETVQQELVDLQDRKRDLCIRRADLKTDVSKISRESLTCVEEVKELKEKCQQLEIELKDCSITQKHMLVKENSLRQDLASVFEKCHLKTAKAIQLRTRVERQRSRSRQLEGVMQEASIILRHIMQESEESSDTQGTMERLLDILECSFHQETDSTFDVSAERNSGGQKPHTSDPKPDRKLCSQKTNNSADVPPLAAQQTVSEAGTSTSADC